MSRGNRNISHWAEIEEMDFMAGTFDEVPEVVRHKDAAWKWLEMIQSDGKLRALDIIRISALVENAYAAGRAIGKYETTENEKG